jgi:hypothetical protein
MAVPLRWQIDILPSLKDPQRKGIPTRALMRPFRWVPSADGFARRSLRRRSGRIPPLVRTLIALTRSAWSAKSHLTQAKTACDLRLSVEIWPQDGHVREVFWGGTARNRPPSQSILYSSCRRNSAQPWSSIDRLSPAFARTFRVVFADGGRSLVQVIPAGVGNTDVDALDLGFSLFPVVRKLFLAAHSLLRFAEIGGVAPEGIQWGADSSMGESGKADHAHIDACGIALGDALFYFTHCLDGDEPFAVTVADGDVSDRAKNFPAVPVTNPAQLGQKYPAVGLIQFEPLRETDVVSMATFPETREFGPFLKEVSESRSRFP